MDPYIERPAIWPDFHNRLIACVCGELQPMLRPRYVALTEERLYVVESERPIRPDVSMVHTAREQDRSRAALSTAVIDTDPPAVFEFWSEEIREPLIHIIEPAAGNRIVTAIEVISPDNKSPGPGRIAYCRKRDELWSGGANLVEIDLLRNGEPTVRVTAEKLQSLRPWHYIVAITRRWPSREEVYAIPLTRRLPRVAIPLAADDRDVTLDLQTVYTRCWNEGPYPELLHYTEPPPGPMSPDEILWCQQILTEAALR
jgi:hypothetical protein